LFFRWLFLCFDLLLQGSDALFKVMSGRVVLLLEFLQLLLQIIRPWRRRLLRQRCRALAAYQLRRQIGTTVDSSSLKRRAAVISWPLGCCERPAISGAATSYAKADDLQSTEQLKQQYDATIMTLKQRPSLPWSNKSKHRKRPTEKNKKGPSLQ